MATNSKTSSSTSDSNLSFVAQTNNSSYSLPKTLSSWRLFYKHLNHLIDREGFMAMGRTSPNPSVAALLYFIDYKDKKIILIHAGTERFGSRHAEVVVLDSYDELIKKNPRYIKHVFRFFVSLEPCTHYGKTPPCNKRLLFYDNLKRITIKNLDPNLKKSSIQDFKNKGIFVILNNNLKKINNMPSPLDGFFERIRRNRSRLHVKIALSQDLCMGIHDNRLLITKKQLQSIGMRLRLHIDAVFTGPGTILGDCPGLDFRQEDYAKKTIAKLIKYNSFFSHFLDSGLENVNLKDYQPDRLFLLGEYEPGYEKFLDKQKQISSRTGIAPVYFILEKNAKSWQLKNLEIEILQTNRDSLWQALQTYLCKRYNNVMIEAGYKMFHSLLQGGLLRGDFLWVLKSKKSSNQLMHEQKLQNIKKENQIFIPEELLNLNKKVFEVELEEGNLEVFQI